MLEDKDLFDINVEEIKDDTNPDLNQEELSNEEIEKTEDDNLDNNRYIYETYDDDLEEDEELPPIYQKIIKTLWIVLIVLILLLLLFIGYRLISSKLKRNENVNANNEVSLKDSIVFKKDSNGKDISSFEYGTDIIDPISLIDKHDGNVKADNNIDTSKVGDITITYTFTKANKDKEDETYKVKKSYTIKDTNNPTITFNQPTIELELYAEFNPDTNIKEVVDIVDGALTKADALDNNNYTVTSNVDTNVEGEYSVKVKAQDKNGNKSSNEYKVVVKNSNSEQPTLQQEVTPTPITPAPEVNPEPIVTPEPVQEHVHTWQQKTRLVFHEAEYETVVVVDQEAYDETVKVKDAYDEEVWVEAYTDDQGNLVEGHYETIHYDEEYQTIHHDQVSHEEKVLKSPSGWVNEVYYVCSECGAERD